MGWGLGEGGFHANHGDINKGLALSRSKGLALSLWLCFITRARPRHGTVPNTENAVSPLLEYG